jgi:hypothetical protein
MDPAALLLAPDVSAVHGGVAYGRDLERRLAPSFERAEPRQRAMASRRGRLGRRRLSPPTELTADGVVAAQAPTLEAVVPGAGRRGSIDSGVEAATGAGGWDPDDVRRWTGWDRPITLAR